MSTFPPMSIDSCYKFERADNCAALNIWLLFLFDSKSNGFEKIACILQRRIKRPDETNVATKIAYLTEDKNAMVISLLQLSHRSVFKEMLPNEPSKPYSKIAVISATNPDVLCTSEANVNVRRLCQFMHGISLNIRDTLWLSPISIIRNMRTKGSAPGENRKVLDAESINLMLVVLGWSGEKPTGSIEVFDSNSQKWSFFQRETPFIRAYHGLALLNNSLYVVGGFNGEICLSTTLCLSLRTRHWRRKSPMSLSRCYLVAVALGGLVYAIGGHSGLNRLKFCERFDPHRNEWTRIADMMYRRSDAAGVESNGKILVTGGYNGFQFHSTAELYNPVTDQWTLIESMLHPRSGHSMVSFDGYLYALGGYDGQDRLQSVEKYDEDTDTWESFVPMSIGRSNFCTAVFQQEIFVIGGYDGDTTIPSVEKLDMSKMEWQAAPDLNIHRSACGICVVKNPQRDSSCAVNELVPVFSANIEEPSP